MWPNADEELKAPPPYRAGVPDSPLVLLNSDLRPPCSFSDVDTIFVTVSTIAAKQNEIQVVRAATRGPEVEEHVAGERKPGYGSDALSGHSPRKRQGVAPPSPAGEFKPNQGQVLAVPGSERGVRERKKLWACQCLERWDGRAMHAGSVGRTQQQFGCTACDA